MGGAAALIVLTIQFSEVNRSENNALIKIHIFSTIFCPVYCNKAGPMKLSSNECAENLHVPKRQQ